LTLNDLERHNGRVFCVISPNSVAFETYYEDMVEDTPIPRMKCSPKNIVLANVNSRSRSLYMSSSVRLSVCLSVTFMHPTQAIEIFGNIFISYERPLILVF